MNYPHLSIEERSCIRKQYVSGNPKVLPASENTIGAVGYPVTIRLHLAGADTVVSSQDKSKAYFTRLIKRKKHYYMAIKLADYKAPTIEVTVVAVLPQIPAELVNPFLVIEERLHCDTYCAGSKAPTRITMSRFRSSIQRAEPSPGAVQKHKMKPGVDKCQVS